MLGSIVNKAVNYLEVYDLEGTKHKIKLLNFTSAGSRTSKLDRQCIVPIDSSLKVGKEIKFDNDTILIVSYKEVDFYKNKPIRYVLDCIDTNQTIDVYRTELKKSTQGGLSHQEETIVYHNVPVKVGLFQTIDSKLEDLTIPKYTMYLSIKYELQSGDRIVISDTTFEVAKVNSIMHITPGLIEVRFDKDPRWL